ncbi:MAG: hypothetical protein WD648_11940 [Planctomycetaceae bacterium]
MKVCTHDVQANWEQPLLCVTHSDRPIDRERCSLNFLTQRYAAGDRLPPKEPFESLVHARHHSPYLGEVTVWDVSHNVGGELRPRLISRFRPETDKPQHAIWYDGRLWVLGLFSLEAYDKNLAHVGTVADPWLSGAHTIFPTEDGRLLVSCSASDSVLVVDPRRYEVVQALRLPESLYGVNYPLSRGDSVVEHFVPNDYQLTHLNCAYPWKGGILVSTLIQGAVGWFDPHGNYQELLRGFVGCHGVRVDPRDGRIYFCDSCLGVVVFLTADLGVHERLQVGLDWLHDATHIDGSLYAAAVSDRNAIAFVDIDRREIVGELPCEQFGQSTQFLYYGR